MDHKLVQSIQVTLLQHGITPTVANPIKVNVVSTKGDVNLQMTFPLNNSRELIELRSIKISDVDLPTLNKNALTNGGLTTVGSILDFVQSHGYKSMLRFRNFGEKGFKNLRELLWGMNLVLDDNWKFTHKRDWSWEIHFGK